MTFAGLVEENLLNPTRYGTWRGPSWMNVAWLLLEPLRELGYVDAAARIARGMIDAVERGGLREYYDPRSGQGLAARGFSMSALVADMAD